MDMDGMTMSISGLPTNTMSGMAMPSSTGSMDMSSSTEMMGMDAMAMTFFTSTTTPLFSPSWVPQSAGQYAGTCIFLIALAAIFRMLLALRPVLLRTLESSRSFYKGDAFNVQSAPPVVRKWRAKQAVWIASMDVLLTGLAYLL